jgi:hypothetical protein
MFNIAQDSRFTFVHSLDSLSLMLRVMEIGDVLNYLRDRGHNVMPISVSSSGSHIVQIDGMNCSDEEIRLFARLESCKDHSSECDGDFLAKMAMLCKRLVESPSLDALSADEARDLAARVAKLQNPPIDVPLTDTQIEQIPLQANVLRLSMAMLLTREFHFFVDR